MIKGSKRDICMSGKHVMTWENTRIRPCDGARYCRICEAITRKRRYNTLDQTTRLATSDSPKARISETTWYNESTGRRLLWSDLFDKEAEF